MKKLSIHASIGKLTVTEFKKWLKETHPDEVENWELHFKNAGGKLPEKKEAK